MKFGQNRPIRFCTSLRSTQRPRNNLVVHRDIHIRLTNFLGSEDLKTGTYVDHQLIVFTITIPISLFFCLN